MSILLEKLVHSVGRAFYTDDVVVVLDALMRYPHYVREQELAPRLKLQSKTVEKVVNLLTSDRLISFEELSDEHGRNSKYYYIDHVHFFNVILYRIGMLQLKLKESEKEENQLGYYSCPTCHKKYNDIDVVMLMSRDYKFICPDCCPDCITYSAIDSEPHYTLVTVDNRGKQSEIQILRDKVNKQLCELPGSHDGIFEILSELKDKELMRNLPSENIKRGYRASKIVDEVIKNEVDLNLNAKFGPRAHKDRAVEMKQYVMGVQIDSINVVNDSNVHDRPTLTLKQNIVNLPNNREVDNVPEFLRISGVKKVEDIIKERTDATHSKRMKLDTETLITNESNAEELVVKGDITDVYAVKDVKATVEVDDDDIEWEDDEECNIID